jgi:hypothetical protein
MVPFPVRVPITSQCRCVFATVAHQFSVVKHCISSPGPKLGWVKSAFQNRCRFLVFSPVREF